MFIDEVKIKVISGKGGNGCVSLHREKFMPKGGPDGGDGGDGGDVWFYADHNMQTLMDFRYKRKFKAGSGTHGMGNNKTGARGDDVRVPVPPGTQVIDAENGDVLLDITEGEHLFLKGGRGGKGNAHFATSRKQTPRYAQDGLPGEERVIMLELKLMADVGFVGLPNAGKSTLLSRMTHAHPKIAGYPFTTTRPHLGIVSLDMGRSFVLADIPGIIEGASEGKGLGHQFLRHIERTRFLAYVIDITKNPEHDYEVIRQELSEYSPILARRKHVVLLNKADTAPVEEREFYKGLVPENAFFTSGVTGEGLKDFAILAERELAAFEEDIEDVADVENEAPKVETPKDVEES